MLVTLGSAGVVSIQQIYVSGQTKCHMVFFTTKILQNKLGYTS